ncbi:MAG: PAS domain S-box protein [Bacteroidetes bacterium]|nr:MAG: PAS domain S-box protein [Bacteroidota bacterium]
MAPLVTFDEKQFSEIFPFFIMIDRDMKLSAIGKTLEKLFPGTCGYQFSKNYTVKRPQLESTDFDSVRSLSDQMIVIECNNEKKTPLRGQIEYLPNRDQLLFIGSPWFGSMEQIKANNLNLHDFAHHDPMIDLLHVLKTQEITTNDLKELLKRVNKQKNELKKATEEIQNIALFPMENPDPLVRMDFEGNMLTINPVAEQLTEFFFEDQLFSRSEFWKKIALQTDTNIQRTIVEAKSGSKQFSFVIRPIPENGYFNVYGRDITSQKQREDQLRILSSIAAENTHGVVIADKFGKIEWANRSFEVITGYSLEELKGHKPGKILQGKDTDPHTVAYLKQQIELGEPFDCEILNYHKSGQPYWLRIQGQALKDKNGNIQKYFAIEEDVTEKKETEKRLKEYENRFRIALERIGDNLWEYDYHTEETIFSNPDSNFIGATSKEILKTNTELWWDCIHPDDKPMVEENSKKYDRGEIDYHSLQYRMVSLEGVERWVLDRGVVIEKDKSGKPIRIIGTHTDITAQKTAEQAIKIKEEKYRNIIDNINLGLVEVDLNENIIFANARFCDMSGYRMSELEGQDITKIFGDTVNSEIIKSKQVLRKKGISDAYELEVKNKQGEKKWWLISGAPNFNDKGELIGSTGIHLDITEQKNLELELIEAKNAAEESARAKELFLANMSHEIRTPMNAIIGMSNQLGKTILDKDQNFYLDTIHSAADSLLIIINDILDLSKVEAGMLTLENIGFEPKAVLDRVMHVMKHKAEEKGLKFTNSYCDDRLSPVLIGDPYRLNQVLLNLVSNAIKFTDAGSVDVNCHLIRETDEHQLIRISVIDTGIGMDETYLDNLYQKFSQEDLSTTRRYGGTGLGMSICKELIELMEGRINISSKKGAGTHIDVDIELMKGSMNDLTEDTTVQTDTKLLDGKKILVADDNEMNRLVASTILKNYGALIKTAGNGLEAFELLKQEPFDLVLMDIQMPVMDGMEATAKIRQEISKDLPIIALTAYAIKGDDQKFLGAGMDDYLSKPFEENVFLQVITRWLGRERTVPNIPEQKAKPKLLYDLSTLEQIAQGNEPFIKQMIDLFIDQSAKSLLEIKKAYREGNFETVSKVAHRLKPSIDNMGITSLKEIIREIEKSAETLQFSPTMDSLIQDLENGIERVTSQLKEA